MPECIKRNLKKFFVNKKAVAFILGIEILVSIFAPLQSTIAQEPNVILRPEESILTTPEIPEEIKETTANVKQRAEEEVGKEVEFCEFCPKACVAGVLCKWYNPLSWRFCLAAIFETLKCSGLYILSLPVRIALFLPAVIIGLLGLAFGLLFTIATNILTWVVGNILNVGITPGNAPQIIGEAWRFTRDFVNMFFILIAVFIGLATILKIREYEAKKTLPLLIIIALLINFTPVIVGFIVDMGNILTNFFLREVRNLNNLEETVLEQARNYFSGAAEIFKIDGAIFSRGPENDFPIFQKLLRQAGELIVYGIVLIFFYIFAVIIYFFIILVFIFRVIVLWILMILAPIAFAGYILPATRRWWREWWQALIQWSFIGVPIAFFLYLSTLVIRAHVEILAEFGGSPEAGFLSGLIAAILVPFISLALLLFGVFLSLREAPSGARTIVSLGKKGYKAAGKFALGETIGRYLAKEEGKERMKKLREAKLKLPSLEGWKEMSKGRKALTAAAVGLAAGAYPFRWALRYAAGRGLEYGAAQERDITRLVEEYEKRFGKDIERAAATYSRIPVLQWKKKIALGLYLGKTKGGEGLGKLQEQLREVTELTAKYSPAKLEDIVKHRQELITDEVVGKIVRDVLVRPQPVDMTRVRELVAEGLSEKEAIRKAHYEALLRNKDVKELLKLGFTEAEAIQKAAYKKVVDALKNEDIDTLSRETIEKPEFQEMVARFKPWAFIRKLGEEKGLGYLEKLQGRVETEIKGGIEEIAKTNPTFLRAPYTPGGRLLLRQWEKSEGDIDRMIREAPRRVLSEDDVKEMIRRARPPEEPTPPEGPPGVPPGPPPEETGEAGLAE